MAIKTEAAGRKSSDRRPAPQAGKKNMAVSG